MTEELNESTTKVVKPQYKRHYNKRPFPSKQKQETKVETTVEKTRQQVTKNNFVNSNKEKTQIVKSKVTKKTENSVIAESSIKKATKTIIKKDDVQDEKEKKVIKPVVSKRISNLCSGISCGLTSFGAGISIGICGEAGF